MVPNIHRKPQSSSGTGRRGGGGDRKRIFIHLSLHWHHQNDTCIKMGQRWQPFKCFINCEGQNHKTVSVDHNFWRERRAEADSNRGPSAYQPNVLSLPLGQTGSTICYCFICPAYMPTRYLRTLSPIRIAALLCIDGWMVDWILTMSKWIGQTWELVTWCALSRCKIVLTNAPCQPR